MNPQAIILSSRIDTELAELQHVVYRAVQAHIAAFEYYGGLPEVIVPDQLKTGVKTSCRYDPEINPVYAELCAHYGVVVIPARPLEPRDKAKVENGVLQAQRRILASLRNHTFFSLIEINDAIAGELEKLNNRPMQGIGKSRNELFAEIDAVTPVRCTHSSREARGEEQSKTAENMPHATPPRRDGNWKGTQQEF